MRFRFTAPEAESHGVRLIKEIPEFRLAKVEGRNGIGKTLAARLLELISGEQPYASLPHAWQSLVNLLGEAHISIEGLPEGLVEVHLDSGAWRGRSQADCAANPGSVTLAGELSSWPEVRSLIQIRRIAGDEGLAETLGRTLRERSLEALDGQRQLKPVVEEWSTRLEDLRELISDASPHTLAAARENAAQTIAAFSRASKAAAAAEKDAEAWSETNHLLQALVKAAERVPPLLEAYENFLERHANAERNTSRLEQRLAAEGAAQVQDAQRRSELQTWSRRLDLRQTALARAQLQERQALRYLRLEARPTKAETNARRKDEAQQLLEVEAELRTVDLARTIRRVASNVENDLLILSDIEQQETIADLDRPVSGGQLLTGIRARKALLEGVPRPGEASELERRAALIRERLEMLSRLPYLIETTDRKERNVIAAEEKIAQLLALSSAQRSAREIIQNELRSERGIMLESSTEAVRVLTDVYALIDAEGLDLDESNVTALDEETSDIGDEAYQAAEEALSNAVQAILKPMTEVANEVAEWFKARIRRIAELRRPGNVTERLDWPVNESDLERLREHLQTASMIAIRTRETAEIRADERRRLEDARNSAAAELSSVRLAIGTATTALLSETGHWTDIRGSIAAALFAAGLHPHDLRRGPDGYLTVASANDNGADIERETAAVLHRIAGIAEGVEDAAARIRDAWGTVYAYLGTETSRLAPRIADLEPVRTGFGTRGSGGVLKSWTEREIARILSAETLRAELFEHAEATDVSFDLEDLAVFWRSKDGRRRRRPLEAFSSGEQVFAYTRAKFETFRSIKEKSAYVVVFLDEFGAFVARDRFGQLMSYVQAEALGDIADQVVVMLPLASTTLPQQGQGEGQIFIGENYFVTSEAGRS